MYCVYGNSSWYNVRYTEEVRIGPYWEGALSEVPLYIPYVNFELKTTMLSGSVNYEPLPRYEHISERVGSLIVVQGGRTKDFSEKSEQQLSSVVEIFDPYSESWKQRQVEGNAPSPGTYIAASASLHDDLFSFGGLDGRDYFNTVHRLDTKTWCWSQVSPQNADGAPMPKFGCGMIAFRNGLVVFGGYGVPQGPTEPQSIMKGTGYTDGRGWTNEFHFYNLSKGNSSCFHQLAYTIII